MSDAPLAPHGSADPAKLIGGPLVQLDDVVEGLGDRTREAGLAFGEADPEVTVPEGAQRAEDGGAVDALERIGRIWRVGRVGRHSTGRMRHRLPERIEAAGSEIGAVPSRAGVNGVEDLDARFGRNGRGLDLDHAHLDRGRLDAPTVSLKSAISPFKNVANGPHDVTTGSSGPLPGGQLRL